MNNQYQWLQPFNNQFGDGMVYRQFAIGRTLYAVGFEEIETMNDLSRKGIDILRVNPAFRFPNSGVGGLSLMKSIPTQWISKVSSISSTLV